MNKDFFETFEARKKDFADRGQVGDEIRSELVLANGRTYLVDKIVETADGWLQVDGHDATAEDLPVSLVLPYHQISHVVFTKPRPRPRQAGFSR